MQNQPTPLPIDLAADTFPELHDAVIELVRSLPDPGRVTSFSVDKESCRARIVLGQTSSGSPSVAKARREAIAELADALLSNRVLH